MKNDSAILKEGKVNFLTNYSIFEKIKAIAQNGQK